MLIKFFDYNIDAKVLFLDYAPYKRQTCSMSHRRKQKHATVTKSEKVI